MKIAINGLGRIGRLVLKCIMDADNELSTKVSVAALNDLQDAFVCAHLLKYDSAHGVWDKNVKFTYNSITINDVVIPFSKHANVDNLAWNKYGIDVVFDCTGQVVNKSILSGYVNNGVSGVLVSAPCNYADLTVVYGVNHQLLRPGHRLVSCASCTTNCLAPILSLLHKSFGVIKGMMNTVHSYTADQRLVDGNHKDLYRSRAAAVSIIPTSTGAINSINDIIPELSNKISGFAVRVPTINVSQLLLTVQLSTKVSKNQIKQCLMETPPVTQKILQCIDEPLVSIDCTHSTASAIVSLPFLYVVDDLVHVMAWYDNEWGYVNRMVDVADYFYSHVLDCK